CRDGSGHLRTKWRFAGTIEAIVRAKRRVAIQRSTQRVGTDYSRKPPRRAGIDRGFARMKGRTLLVDLCCAVICTFIAAAAFAQTDPRFAKATQAYAQGHFKEAIGGYEMLV